MDEQYRSQKLREGLSSILRYGNQLMREQCSCCPLTMQQYYTLEAIIDDSKQMKEIACEVGFHQSTMTRIVDKLAQQGLLTRTRQQVNQRAIDISITPKGREICLNMREQTNTLCNAILDDLPEDRQQAVVEGLSILTEFFSPECVDRCRSLCCASKHAGGSGTCSCHD